MDRTGAGVGDVMEVRRARVALLSPAVSHSVGVGHPESVAPWDEEDSGSLGGSHVPDGHFSFIMREFTLIWLLKPTQI